MANFLITLGFGVSAIFFCIISGVVDISKFTNKKEKQEKLYASLTKSLRRFGTLKSYEVLGKTTLKFEDETHTFDAILLGYFGTIAVTADYHTGEIYGQTNDERWTCIFNNEKTYFPNPLTETNGTVRFFKDIYKTEKIKSGNVDSVVIFASKKSSLFTGKNNSVITIDDINNKLGASKYITDNGADIEAMKKAIEKYTVK